VRTIDWAGDHVVIVDQTLLPGELRTVELRTVDELIDAIRRLAVRGAPAIGVAGALGVALAGLTSTTDDEIRRHAAALRSSRPTAVNLAWAVDRVLRRLPGGPPALVEEALAILEADVATNRALGRRGADWVQSRFDGPVSVHTHCNTGALASVEWGTALGIVGTLHERGAVREVFADETRPLLQGARLTAFELEQMGVPYRLLADAAGPSVIARGLVDLVVVGADRIAANGDVANKIGTYPLALAASAAGVPFVVAAPESTVDAATATGADIVIEERDPEEVLGYAGTRTAPACARAFNPAFDVTPHDLVTAIITEDRVITP
jgi:methylthioribose-1-phosphate isomerase